VTAVPEEHGDLEGLAALVAARLTDDRPLLSPRALGQRLGVSERTARDLIQSGRLRSVKVGGSRRVEPAEVDRYVASLRDEEEGS
jgi:excisionase family DNA binding protein